MDYDIDKWDIDSEDEIFKPLNKKNKKNVEMTRDYCDEHEFYYSNQTCEPKWKWGQGDLEMYFGEKMNIDHFDYRWVDDRIKYYRDDGRLLNKDEMKRANDYWKKYGV